jgi:hypothetical protein
MQIGANICARSERMNMKALIKSKKLWVGIVIGLVLIFSINKALQTQQMQKAKTMSEELFKPEQSSPFCFGRLMFDLPKHAVVTGSNYNHPSVDNFETTENVTKEDFEKKISDFESQLRNIKHKKDPSLLKEKIEVTGIPNAKIFVHWENDFSEHLVTVTGFRWFNNKTQIKLVSEISTRFLQSAPNEIVEVIKGLRPRAVNEVPTEHGFCIEGGFFPDQQTGQWVETADLAVGFSPWADVSISIETLVSHQKDPDTLLDRINALGAPPFSINLIRKGARDSGPHKGQEVLFESTQRGHRTYTFIWETDGEIDNNQLPHIHLEMRFGHEGKRLLSKDEALALYEYVLAHLRVRPVIAAPLSHTNPPQSPLGELVSTGNICPQTGWWQCSEGGEVVGGKRQFLKQGEPAPHAFIMDAPSLLQKLQGKRPSYKITTVWTLVDYEAVVTATQTQPTSVIDSTNVPDASPPHNEA